MAILSGTDFCRRVCTLLIACFAALLLSFAPLLATAAALPARAGLPLATLDFVTDALSPLIKARVFCESFKEGNTTVRTYCRDGYICVPNSNKCEPGPELKRQREREQEEARQSLERARERARKLQEHLEQEAARMRAHVAGLVRKEQRTQRVAAMNEIYRGQGYDDRRLATCGPSRLWRSAVDLCVGDAARTVTGPINFDSRDHVRRVPTVRTQYGAPLAGKSQVEGARTTDPYGKVKIQPLRATARVHTVLWRLLDHRENLQPKDPIRETINREIRTIARLAKANGIDTDEWVKKYADVDPNSDADDPGISRPDTGSGTGTQQAAVPPAKLPSPRISLEWREEAVCSFLADIQSDRPGQLAIQLPDTCKNYSAVAAQRQAQQSQQRDPRFRLRVDDYEEMKKLKTQFESLLPPGLYGN
ncbi:MAG: hypothetical protein AB7O50_10765 [Pseudolabrys sp.]